MTDDANSMWGGRFAAADPDRAAGNPGTPGLGLRADRSRDRRRGPHDAPPRLLDHLAVIGHDRLDDLRLHQIAAVGDVQRPGLDLGEIGNQRAQLSDVLDASDQRGIGRIVFVDHRGTLAAAVIDHQVDFITAQRRTAAIEAQQALHG